MATNGEAQGIARQALSALSGVGRQAAAAIWCILGDYSFSLETSWDELKGKEEVSYADHDIIDGKPATQRIAPKLTELDLKIVFDGWLCDPVQGLKDLRAIKDSEAPHSFVLGDGTYRGQFVLTELEVETTRTAVVGTPARVECKIKLREYWERPRPATQPAPKAKPRSGSKPPQAQKPTVETKVNPDGFEYPVIRK